MQIQTRVLRERLTTLSSKELMDPLMAADMPMGGTNAQRIERLVCMASPVDVSQFLR